MNENLRRWDCQIFCRKGVPSQYGITILKGVFNDLSFSKEIDGEHYVGQVWSSENVNILFPINLSPEKIEQGRHPVENSFFFIHGSDKANKKEILNGLVRYLRPYNVFGIFSYNSEIISIAAKLGLKEISNDDAQILIGTETDAEANARWNRGEERPWDMKSLPGFAGSHDEDDKEDSAGESWKGELQNKQTNSDDDEDEKMGFTYDALDEPVHNVSNHGEEWNSDTSPAKEISPKQLDFDNLDSLEDSEIVKQVMQYYKEHGKIRSDDILKIYDVAKKRKSNKLTNLIQQLSKNIKESKDGKCKLCGNEVYISPDGTSDLCLQCYTDKLQDHETNGALYKENKSGQHMKKELMEYLVRRCVREVLTQVNESSLQRCPKCGAATDDSSGTVKCSGCDWAGDKINENQDNFHTDSQGKWCKECGGKAKEEKDVLGGKKYKCTDTSCKSNRKKLKEGDPEIKGASAAPADGQGSAGPLTGTIPNTKDTVPEHPSEKETPPEASLKGTVLVNPRDKSKIRKVPISSKDDSGIERELYRLASTVGGRGTKVALATRRDVKSNLNNPKETIYLYIGKYDEASDEVFLLADKSLQVAKEQSLPMGALPKAAIPTDPNVVSRANDPFYQPDPNAPQELPQNPEGLPSSSPVYPPGSEEDAANDYDFIQSVPKQYGVNEPMRLPDDPDSNDQIDEVKKLVKKMVSEVLNRK